MTNSNNAASTPVSAAFTTDAQAIGSTLGQLLYQNFLQAQGIGFTSSGGVISVNSPLTGDWASFEGLIASTNPPPFDSANDFIQSAFVNSFNHFLATNSWNVLFGSNGLLPDPANALTTSGNEIPDFLNGYATYLAQTSSIATSPFGTGSNPSQPSAGTNPVPVTSYYQMYEAFVLNHNTNTGNPATDTNFQQALGAFYNQTVQKYGYFLPSQFQQLWLNYVQGIGQNVTDGSGALPAANDISDNSKLQILDTVLHSLISVINTTQLLAVNQANRLSFYSNYQKAYTDLVGKIPTILTAQLAPIQGTAPTKIRSAMQNINSNYSSTLRAYRSQVGQQGQALQSNITNLNSNVTQTANLIESMLKELATLGSSVLTI
jgi:hypothetical protein